MSSHHCVMSQASHTQPPLTFTDSSEHSMDLGKPTLFRSVGDGLLQSCFLGLGDGPAQAQRLSLKVLRSPGPTQPHSRPPSAKPLTCCQVSPSGSDSESSLHRALRHPTWPHERTITVSVCGKGEQRAVSTGGRSAWRSRVGGREVDIGWASISRKAISQEPLGVCAAGGSCRLDGAQVLMVPGLPGQEGTKCGDRQTRLRGTE